MGQSGNSIGKPADLSPTLRNEIDDGVWAGESAAADAKVVVELKSVNRKQSELVVMLPPDWESLENRIRESVARVVSRGRCEIRVSLDVAEGESSGIESTAPWFKPTLGNGPRWPPSWGFLGPRLK